MDVVMHIPVYEDRPVYDIWLKLIIGGVLALTFVLGVALIREDTGVAVTMFGVTLFDALLFKTVIPRRFQIFDDRLKIVLGWPFVINILFSNIADARSASRRKIFVYWGIRFATSTRHVVEIVRKKGLNLVISPSKEDMFLEELKQAMKLK